NASTLATIALPADAVSLPDVQQTDEDVVRVTGKGSDGAVLLRGQSLPFTFGALAGQTLDVFVQRTGEFARMPGDFDDREAPLVALADGRFVLSAGGSSSTAWIYDLLAVAPLASPQVLPRVPKSIATMGTTLLLIDDQGATAFDLSSSSKV